MNSKTYVKGGELVLDFAKIIFAIGIIGPFINNGSLNYYINYGIIVTVAILLISGLFTYNKGVNDE